MRAKPPYALGQQVTVLETDDGNAQAESQRVFAIAAINSVSVLLDDSKTPVAAIVQNTSFATAYGLGVIATDYVHFFQDRPCIQFGVHEGSSRSCPLDLGVLARTTGSRSGFHHLDGIATCRPDEPAVEGQHRFTFRGGTEVQRIGEVHALLHAGQRPGHKGRVL